MKTLHLFLFLGFASALFAQAETDFIHIDQFGYRPNDEKIAVISNPKVGYNAGDAFAPGSTYEVKNSAGTTVFTGDITAWDDGNTDASSGDQCWHFDFSPVTDAGNYYVYDPVNQVQSYPFSISETVYQDVLKQSLRAFFYQRCGMPKAAPFAQADWTDGACHLGNNQDLACRLVTDAGNAATEKDLSGGWHDAGDYNKYVNYAFSPVHDLLAAYEENPTVWDDNLNIPESGNGIPDILDEIKWELDWLLKMQLADGSVLMKVSVPNFQTASPPSDDATARFYGPAQSSATRTACSIFAHAAIVYQNAGLTAYANTLQTHAESAWTWLQNHSGYSDYDNSGFASSNPEVSHYDQDATSFAAAVYLFVLTNQATYQAYVDAHYGDIHAMNWTFWYPFESTYQDALLYYAACANGTASVQSDILSNFETSVKTNNAELLPAYQAFSSPYRAYVEANNYVWGSNKVKAHSALLFYNMITYDVDPVLQATYLKAAENYVHYLHGVNPQNLVYLSNMNAHGAEKSCTQIYHGWFADGSALDLNPAPGFVPGGPNKDFDPPINTTIAPPENQPNEKAYKDWNTSYPENSWEITEPADSYQAAYVKMLSKFATPSTPLPVNVVHPLMATTLNNRQVLLQWTTDVETHNLGFEIQRSGTGHEFKKLDFIPAKSHTDLTKTYQVIDSNPLSLNYYRYKQIDLDGHFTFSPVVSLRLLPVEFRISPNVISGHRLHYDVRLTASAKGQLVIYDISGHRVWSSSMLRLPKGATSADVQLEVPGGLYYGVLRMDGLELVESFWMK